MRASLALVTRLAVVLAAPIVLGAQQSRDVARPSIGSASLSGIVVTDEADGRPVRRATVTISIPGDLRSPRIVATDDEGRFAIAGLPAGNFTLSASKPGYVTSYYGARRPGSTLGVPIAVTDGQQVTSIRIQLWRGAVITGSVRDWTGRPVPSVSVRLQRVATARTGQRTITSATVDRFSTASTDDRGLYRIFGLPPGDYVIQALPVMPGALFPGQPSGEIQQVTNAELQWAERQIRGTTAPNPSPGAAPARGPSVAISPVYHPGVAEMSSATVVSLAAGQERSGVDIRLQLVPTALVAGRVANVNGLPASGVQLTLMSRGDASADVRAMALVEVGLMAAPSVRSGSDGAFVIRGVQPGQYMLMARQLPSGRSGQVTAGAGVWAVAPVDVSGRDIQGLALTLEPGMSVAGRVAFEGAAPPPDQRVTVRLIPTQTAAAFGPPSAQTGAAGQMSFKVPGVVPGAYRVATTSNTGGALSGWVLKSAVLNGRDVADAAFDVRPLEDVTGLVVTLVPPAQLSGALSDGVGRPTSDLSMMLFAADRALWFQGSRRLRAPVRPASDGRFSFTGLPPGEYYLAALTDHEPNDWYDPEFLEQVVPGAIKVTLADGERKTQDLKLAGGK